MGDFLTGAFSAGPPVSPEEVAVRLLAALAMGFAVAGIHRAARGGNGSSFSFRTTLVLLSVLIAMVTEIVGDNVARAFSLVGALSIVRFRTVVRDTQDTAYVMFAVAVGMAMGAGNLWVAAIGAGIVGVGAALTVSKGTAVTLELPAVDEFRLSVTLRLGMDTENLSPVCDGFTASRALRSFGTTRQGAAMRAVYGIRMRAGKSPEELVQEINRVEGVQSVEIERPEDSEE